MGEGLLGSRRTRRNASETYFHFEAFYDIGEKDIQFNQEVIKGMQLGVIERIKGFMRFHSEKYRAACTSNQTADTLRACVTRKFSNCRNNMKTLIHVPDGS